MRKILQVIALVGFTTLALAANPNSIKQKLAERVAAHPNLAQTSTEVFSTDMIKNCPTILDNEVKPTILAQTTETTTSPSVVTSALRSNGDEGECGCNEPCKIERRIPTVEDCEIPGLSLGSGPLGVGEVRNSNTEFQLNQALNIEEHPDLESTHEEETAFCSSEETTIEECSKGYKVRQFCIEGEINVAEKVSFRENGI